MSGIFFANVGDDKSLADAISHMDRVTREWEMRAARGECGWICSSCCDSYPKGMPDACGHGHQECTDIIQRDKRNALAAAPATGATGGGV